MQHESTDAGSACTNPKPMIGDTLPTVSKHCKELGDNVCYSIKTVLDTENGGL